MRKISLTQGKYATVDDADYEWLSQYNCYAIRDKKTDMYRAFIGMKIKGKWTIVDMGRVILGLQKSDKRHTDHINHNTLDNRRFNLRAITCQQNQFNRPDVKGYYWNKKAGKYYARIKFNRKTIHLGLYTNKNDARVAYLTAKEIYHKF